MLQITGYLKKEMLMNNKKLLFSLFVITVLAQLYVPAKMIMDKEEVLLTGKEFKFKTRPIDPSDPFRGKYIILYFEENEFELEGIRTWTYGDQLYVIVEEDEEGFARIVELSEEKPSWTSNYFKSRLSTIKNPILVIFPAFRIAFVCETHFDFPPLLPNLFLRC